MKPPPPLELTEWEQLVITTLALLEVEGATPTVDELAQRAGLTATETRAVLSRLTEELGLVHEEPDPDGLGERYSLTGRAGAGGRAWDRDVDDVRAELGRALARLEWPAEKDDIARLTSDRGAPRALVYLVRQLDDRRYLNVQEVADQVEALARR